MLNSVGNVPEFGPCSPNLNRILTEFTVRNMTARTRIYVHKPLFVWLCRCTMEWMNGRPWKETLLLSISRASQSQYKAKSHVMITLTIFSCSNTCPSLLRESSACETTRYHSFSSKRFAIHFRYPHNQKLQWNFSSCSSTLLFFSLFKLKFDIILAA